MARVGVRRRRLFWQIFPAMLLFVVLVVTAASWRTAAAFRALYVDERAGDLLARAWLLEHEVRERLHAGVDALCKQRGSATGTRITVVLPDGVVVGESDRPVAGMRNLAGNPEVRAALAGEVGKSVAFSPNVAQEMLFAAIPVREGDTVLAAIRTGVAVTAIDRVVRRAYVTLTLAGAAVALGAAGLGLVVARRLSRPFELLHKGTERFARGELSYRLPVPRGAEASALAERLNEMADRLEERIRTIQEHNRAQREFVANVSHELRTPITSIKGAVETLSSGALQDPEAAPRFLAIAARHADRLSSIIEDLLTVAQIEARPSEELATAVGNVGDVLAEAVASCQAAALARGVRVEIVGGAEARAAINPPLLEQAVRNLVDNAVKFSEAGSDVRVEAAELDREVVIRVRDHGPGIPAEHLPRLFERFYRVDKARSRELGGTGLGLAIVQQIARVHGGRVSAASVPGEGSTFTIHLPAPAGGAVG